MNIKSIRIAYRAWANINRERFPLEKNRAWVRLTELCRFFKVPVEELYT